MCCHRDSQKGLCESPLPALPSCCDQNRSCTLLTPRRHLVSTTCNGWKLYSTPMNSTPPHERPTADCLHSLNTSFVMSRWRMANKGKTSAFLLLPAKGAWLNHRKGPDESVAYEWHERVTAYADPYLSMNCSQP